MPDILQQLPIDAPIERVFAAISTPEGLDQWWTQSSIGVPEIGQRYQLNFTTDYQWAGVVVACDPPRSFAIELTDASADWVGTVVEFGLRPDGSSTILDFTHRGWPETSDHFRISAHCWACYLRILRRGLTHGEVVPYEDRLSV